jgi:hypothetical protein
VRRICLLIVLGGCGFDATAPAGAPPIQPLPPSAIEPVQPPVDPTAGENVELKLELDDAAAALATLGLTDTDADTVQTVWFYDTTALVMYDAGVILRARKVKNGADDTTIKARPMLPDQTAPGWLASPGAKCEVDRTLDIAASSCQLTRTPATGDIDAVAAGAAIAELYDADQLVFLGSVSPGAELDSLARLGPIPSTVWTLTPTDVPAELDLERWVLADGSTLLEASIRVPHDDADAGLAALLAWASENSLALSADQDSKTRAALLTYAQ